MKSKLAVTLAGTGLSDLSISIAFMPKLVTLAPCRSRPSTNDGYRPKWQERGSGAMDRPSRRG